MLFCVSRPPLDQLPGLEPALRGQLLRQQFAGQSAAYRAHYPAAAFDIIEQDGTPIGRIVVEIAAEAIRIADIALRPEWRGRGIGTALIAGILGDADRPVRLSVRHGNIGAQRLYTQLGFTAIETNEIEVRMERTLPSPASRTVQPRLIPGRLSLPFAFDPAPLASECAALASRNWAAHFATQNDDGDWSVIPLRSRAGAAHPVMMIYAGPVCRDYAATPFLEACPAIRAVLARFECPLQAVRLMRLGPGSAIKEHSDPGLAFEQGFVRIHLPLVTHPGVDFRLNGSRVVMDAGSAWYLRLSSPHSAVNRSAAARLHLVIDALVNPWVEALFAAALADDGALLGAERKNS